MTDTKASTRARVGPLLRRAAEAEAAMWRSLYLWARRRPLPLGPGDEPFGYLGVVKPILGIFIGLSVVEIPIFDLIVTHVVPWRPARWIVLGLGVWGLLWMIGLFASMTIHPHVVGDRGLRVRLSSGIDIWIPWTDIEALRKRYRSLPSSKSVQVEQEGDRQVLHISVGSQTSIDVLLRRPTTFDLPKGRSTPMNELRLYADDPDGLLRSARGTPASNTVSR
ncbi:PH domain-containing protein [Micromonospora sp. CA-259024]|uniref:PH domain-containing protein n=1 Tax=Micromonospora sp. CA-259024 TaxID=3239965 RepID=UPI003D8ED7CE